METDRRQKRIRSLLVIFISALVFSGLTALPIETELKHIVMAMHNVDWNRSLPGWLDHVCIAVADTNSKYPFLAYGTDWLAFAHLIIAVAFVGPLRDPIKNKWVVEFGIIACAAVIPWALVAGEVRDIPFFWRLFDCLFGIGGGLLLILCYFNIRKLETLKERI